MEEHVVSKLEEERGKELKREGVVVELVRFPSTYEVGFAFREEGRQRVMDLISQTKFSLDINSLEGKSVVKYKPGELRISE